ncbi:hypothetical protein MTO96_005342 [Rhipicephalus appendiculatus]
MQRRLRFHLCHQQSHHTKAQIHSLLYHLHHLLVPRDQLQMSACHFHLHLVPMDLRRLDYLEAKHPQHHILSLHQLLEPTGLCRRQMSFHSLLHHSASRNLELRLSCPSMVHFEHSGRTIYHLGPTTQLPP